MSRLQLPSMPAAAKGFVTVAVHLPIEPDDRAETMQVPSMHVVYSRGAGQERLLASPHLPQNTADGQYVDEREEAAWEHVPLGVSLDYLPYDPSMHTPMNSRQQTKRHRLDVGIGSRSYAIAVTGVVPIAVPADRLQGAVLGDTLYVGPRPPEFQYFSSSRLRGSYFTVQCRNNMDQRCDTAPQTYKRVGTIVGLGADGDNQCLVRLEFN